MRPKVAPGRKHTSQGVSLSPEMFKDARKRMNALDVSFSKYVQSLIALDVERKILQPMRPLVAA